MGRTVLERLVGGEMPASDFDARRVGRHQGEGDAQVFLVAQQAVGIGQPERQSHDRRDRRQRDVAFLPAHPHAEDALAVVFAVTDDTAVGQGGGIRPGVGPGQRETGNLLTGGEPGQVMLLLRVGPVFQQ
jgi:hypothetical protein